jgi:hypothetical protein
LNPEHTFPIDIEGDGTHENRFGAVDGYAAYLDFGDIEKSRNQRPYLELRRPNCYVLDQHTEERYLDAVIFMGSLSNQELPGKTARSS